MLRNMYFRHDSFLLFGITTFLKGCATRLPGQKWLRTAMLAVVLVSADFGHHSAVGETMATLCESKNKGFYPPALRNSRGSHHLASKWFCRRCLVLSGCSSSFPVTN